MTRRGLAYYLLSVATYEALISASYAWLPVGPPITLDPRLPINWVCARFLERLPAPLAIVLLISSLWHFTVAIGLLRSSKMIPVFATGETILTLPGLFLYGSVLFGFSGHGFTGGVAALGFLIFAACSLFPLLAAYRLMFSGEIHRNFQRL